MRFTVVNLGCKVNSYDAESVASILENEGYIRSFDDTDCDIAIVFTCAVTNIAAQKSRKLIRRIKKDNPDAILVVAGCYSQIEPDAIEDIDILIGSTHKTKIADYIRQFQDTRKPIRDIQVLENLSFEEANVKRFETKTRAYLKIQDGCNQFCSYCVIPYARGRERSMEPEHVYKEANELFQNHKEIVLTGIHTGRYGKEYGITLADLIENILKENQEDIRIRISSIEITEIDDHLIQLMKTDKRVARHFHIPLQSGCDAILKLMNRPYTTKEYLERISEIRKQIPDISISTDLIVGFPGETEAYFTETMQFLEECAFSFLHVFPYSMRNGTKAASMKEQISPQVKKERVKKCMELSQNLYYRYAKKWLNQTVNVLVEKSEKFDAFGHTSNYLPVRIIGEKPQGEFVDVMIKDIKDDILVAEVD